MYFPQASSLTFMTTILVWFLYLGRLSSFPFISKSLLLLSKTKKKNADHYNKLDKDRKKKNCEYALLVSELEWDQPNDLPIKKVKEYEAQIELLKQITFVVVIFLGTISHYLIP